jgi:tetratricopeptide (TPR) repeat protein
MNRTRIGLLLLGIGCLAGLATLNAQESKPPNPPASSATATAPNVASPTFDDAVRLYRTGKFDAAIQEYQALENGPQAALAYAGITRAYLRKNDPQDAYAAAAKAVELAPDAPDTKVALGDIYFRQGKIIEADHEYVAVVNGGGKIARAYLGLARTSSANSYYHREKQMIDRAHALDPDDPEIALFWIATLPLSDRIKALGDFLAQDTNDGPEVRKLLKQQLVLLQGEASAPAHQCRMVSKVRSTQSDLKLLFDGPNRPRGYGLDIKLNGTSARLLLDTGAGGILVDRTIAEKAGVKQIVPTYVGGVGDNGLVAAFVGHADSIQVGEIEFQDCDIRVEDRNSVVGRDGLIGADVFSHFLVDLNLPDKKFQLSELPPRPGEPAGAASLESGLNPELRFYDRYVSPEMQEYSPIFRFGHTLLIPTMLNDSVSKLFVIDTGAAGNSVSPDAAREVTKVTRDPRLMVGGLSGAVKNVYRGDEITLTFANLKKHNQDIMAFDTKNISDSVGTEVSGFLGYPMLSILDMKIDYRDGLVFFAFDPKRYH